MLNELTLSWIRRQRGRSVGGRHGPREDDNPRSSKLLSRDLAECSYATTMKFRISSDWPHAVDGSLSLCITMIDRDRLGNHVYTYYMEDGSKKDWKIQVQAIRLVSKCGISASGMYRVVHERCCRLPQWWNKHSSIVSFVLFDMYQLMIQVLED